MNSFTKKDATWFAESIRALYTADASAGFGMPLAQLASEHFSCVIAGCELIATNLSRYEVHGAVIKVKPPAGYAAFFHDHPFVVDVAAGRRPTLSHVRHELSPAALSRLDYFNGFLRQTGLTDNLAVAAWRKDEYVTLSLFRDQAYSECERQLLTLIQPHLQAAASRTVTHPVSLRQAPEIFLDRRFAIVGGSGDYTGLIAKYFPGWKGGRVPAKIEPWLRSCSRSFNSGTFAAPIASHRVDRPETSLICRWFHSGDYGHRIRLTEMVDRSVYGRLFRFGLSTREIEVLTWVERGKTNADISAILRISHRTVGKHLEHIMAKLRVPNRAGAVAAARKLIFSIAS